MKSLQSTLCRLVEVNAISTATLLLGKLLRMQGHFWVTQYAIEEKWLAGWLAGSLNPS